MDELARLRYKANFGGAGNSSYILDTLTLGGLNW
jgi:hypothetical protein